MKHFTAEELRRLRNEVPVRVVIERLLQLPHKEIEGVYRFLCPLCNEFETGLNPNTNLSRCFRCEKNFNPIELVMADRHLSFVQSVSLLLQKGSLLNKAPQLQPPLSKADSLDPFEILHQQFSHLSNPYNGD